MSYYFVNNYITQILLYLIYPPLESFLFLDTRALLILGPCKGFLSRSTEPLWFLTLVKVFFLGVPSLCDSWQCQGFFAFSVRGVEAFSIILFLGPFSVRAFSCDFPFFFLLLPCRFGLVILINSVLIKKIV